MKSNDKQKVKKTKQNNVLPKNKIKNTQSLQKPFILMRHCLSEHIDISLIPLQKGGVCSASAYKSGKR